MYDRTGDTKQPTNEAHEPRNDDEGLSDEGISGGSSPHSSSSHDITTKLQPRMNTEGKVEEHTPKSALEKVSNLIRSGQAKNIILLLGAGISTSAGIPDFRSPKTGLYHNLQKLNLPFPEAVFELGFFRKRPEPFWELAKEIYPGKFHPTPTHYFLTLLHQHKVLKRVFTQNIDTLETLAGLPEEMIVEAHGSFARSHCLDCRAEVDREKILRAGVRRGEVVRCDNLVQSKGKKGKDKGVCGGLVKPDIVFFGENLPDRFFNLLPELKQCDLLLIIGTSLQVQPFASLVDRAPSDCPRLLINREPVGPFERLSASGALTDSLKKILSPKGKDQRDMYWQGDADQGIYELVEHLGWSEEFEEVMRNGKKDLERRYKDAEKLEGKVDQDVRAVKEIVDDRDEAEELEEAIRRQLKL
ncbi:NAD-dependent histone deacetylase SIR2 [Kwoniella mangroviensis CBS 10435]|uniref:NAD-dependent protein deacetylase n=1 Tax=Kwoniella mangroviensis CBS 10435 TaxID=1331196 RepID=A0A1B9J179_9TREE|nr:NAD-dependent histone deacetylase SIR2 [Kwoniella mangroviensis CBS 10435]